jgi:hypothetical protein
MKKITSTTELKNAILLMEEKQAVQGKLLKEQFHYVREGLRPANAAKTLFSRFSASTDFKIGLTAAALSLATLYLAKRAIVKSAQKPLKRLFGSLIQAGVSNIISRHPDTIKSVGQVLFQRVFPKKQENKS